MALLFGNFALQLAVLLCKCDGTAILSCQSVERKIAIAVNIKMRQRHIQPDV